MRHNQAMETQLALAGTNTPAVGPTVETRLITPCWCNRLGCPCCAVLAFNSLFPSQGTKVAVPLIQVFIQCCWRRAREKVIREGEFMEKKNTDWHQIVVPYYICGQMVWISTKDLPFWVPTWAVWSVWGSAALTIFPPAPVIEGLTPLISRRTFWFQMAWMGIAVYGGLGGIRSKREIWTMCSLRTSTASSLLCPMVCQVEPLYSAFLCFPLSMECLCSQLSSILSWSLAFYLLAL